MYTQLSSTQQAAIDTNTCPHCHTQGSMREIWTRNGNAVKCDSCSKKVYRPRGRAVSTGLGQTAGGAGGGQAQNVTGAGSSGSGDEEGDSQQDAQQEAGQDKQPSLAARNSPAAANASQKLGKPLSDAAREAITKIESALREEMQKALSREKAELAKERENAFKEMDKEIAAQVDALKPKEILVKRQEADGSVKTVTIPNAHPVLQEILKRINAGLRNFLLVGPSGSGKTTICEHLAAALGVPYFAHNWGGGDTESAIRGKMTANGEYIASPFVSAMGIASVFNNDELDSGDPNVTICINGPLAQNVLYVPSKAGNAKVDRHADNIITVTANTWGVGADMLYCGRNQLDAALKSRFAGGVFFVDYSTQLETQLVPETTYRESFWQVRGHVTTHKLRRIWGTRELIHGAKLLRAGYQLGEVFRALTTGWTQDELVKVGVA